KLAVYTYIKILARVRVRRKLREQSGGCAGGGGNSVWERAHTSRVQAAPGSFSRLQTERTVTGSFELKSYKMDVSILIVSYNTRDLTLQCLRSVYEQTRRCQFEVIVADNASSDGTRQAIERQFRDVRFAGAARNLGFAAANNLASST